MAEIIPPTATRPIVEPNDTMTQQTRTWANNVSKLAVIEGEDGPEGVVIAEVTRWFFHTIDETLFIKASGSGNTGWKQVSLT